MRRSRRHRIAPRALLCFALIAQLLLPVAQAQLMARDGGLAMLACGADAWRRRARRAIGKALTL